jgi:hypothetical protein
MTKQQRQATAEAFVARVTTQIFKQTVDHETVQAVATKLIRSVEVPDDADKKAA